MKSAVGFWAMCALSIGFAVVSCSLYPSMQVDSTGLGHSFVGEAVLQRWTAYPQTYLKQHLEQRLAERLDGQALTVPVAESAGFRCPNGVLSCSYAGHLNYKLSKLPLENSERAHMKASFGVQVMNASPVEVDVSFKEEPVQL